MGSQFTILGNPTMFKFFKLFSPRQIFRKSLNTFSCFRLETLKNQCRNYADTPKIDATNKQIVVQGTENGDRVRVRRARPSDVPRVLRFVREHALAAWPCLVIPAPGPPSRSAAGSLVLCDYVARALSQGHSMVAEQHSPRRGWQQIRGLALGAAACPWDAAVLEAWARCIRCPRSRRALHFSAHCLRAPRLHDKYRLHRIMQVMMIVPPGPPNNQEIVQVLAKNVIQRGRDVGFPLLRFDVNNEEVAKSLESLNLKKEWQLAYEIKPETMQEREQGQSNMASESVPELSKRSHFVAVYTAFTQTDAHI